MVHADGRTGDCICVEVQNGGCIAENRRDALFEPFAAAVHQGGDGLGLGLYISQQIVHAHGGTIGVQSDHGDGTRFRFTIPRRPRGAGELTVSGIVKAS